MHYYEEVFETSPDGLMLGSMPELALTELFLMTVGESVSYAKSSRHRQVLWIQLKKKACFMPKNGV